MTYEADGFENPRPHRMLALMPEWSVRRLRDAGAQAVKILLSWAPGDHPGNDEKRVLIERIGAECDALALPFFLEPVTYDPAGLDPLSPAWAARKPALVAATLREFSQPQYRVDVLKVEFPVVARFVQGSETFRGESVYSMDQALEAFRAADAASSAPYIFLSAGVSAAEFNASLRLAAAAGARFSGVLCGRANWQDGVAAYARIGLPALSAWLSTHGVSNLRAVNDSLRAATPWSAILP